VNAALTRGAQGQHLDRLLFFIKGVFYE